MAALVDNDLPRPNDGLEMFRTVWARSTNRPLVTYFDTQLTAADVDDRSTALADALNAEGFEVGDRLAILTQNDPAFIVAVLAAWKLGGVAVPVNPMYTERELAFLLIDTGSRALVCLEEMFGGVPESVVAGGDTDVVTTILVDREARGIAGSSPRLARSLSRPKIPPC